jgi:hypothetical protein
MKSRHTVLSKIKPTADTSLLVGHIHGCSVVGPQAVA